MKIPRTSRLDSEYRKAISEIISRELKDREPSLTAIISVTEVDVAPDLKTAKAFVSVYANSEEKKEETFRILRENAGFIRRLLSKRMRMRTVPEITFAEDGSMEYGSRIDELLKQVSKGSPSEEDEDL